MVDKALRKRRGFSMVELMLASAIMLMIGGFGLMSLRGGQSSVQSRGLAEELAEELRAARAKAIAEQAPVGIAFPSANASTGIGRSFYQLEGPSEPIATRSVDYSGSYPEAVVFFGIWGTGSTATMFPGVNESGFVLTDWTLQDPTDYHLIFTPSGSVISNGLAHFSGGYFDILVSNGVTEGGGTASGSLVLREPTQVSHPYTVRVSPTGAIGVGRGVWGGPVPEAGQLSTANAAAATPLTYAPNTPPFDVQVSTEPKPNQESDGGAVAVVGRTKYLNILVDALDREGDQLVMRCRAEQVGGGDTGTFSSAFPTDMVFDQSKNRWVGSWTWSPPPSARSGDIFRIVAEVSDDNQTWTPEVELGAQIEGVEIEEVNKLACVNAKGSGGAATFEVAWMNSEGTNVYSLTWAKTNRVRTTPSWSPNGHKLAFYSMEDLGTGRFRARLHAVNDNGSDLRKLFSVEGEFNEFALGPSFSPTSDHVCCSAYDTPTSPDSRVYVSRTYAAPNPHAVTSPPAGYSDVEARWHPTQDWILFTRVNQSAGVRSLMYVNPWGGDEYTITTEGGGEYAHANWSAQGDAVTFVTGNRVRMATVDTSSHVYGPPTTVATAPEPETPRFAPLGGQIAFVNRAAHELYVVDLATGVKTRMEDDPLIEVDQYSWSTPGDEIVFNGRNEELYVVNVPTKFRKLITPPGFTASTTPAWWVPSTTP